jgi:hypothetical protein
VATDTKIDTKFVTTFVCGPGSYLTPWHRYLADSFGTRSRYLGDGGPGTCFTSGLT